MVSYLERPLVKSTDLFWTDVAQDPPDEDGNADTELFNELYRMSPAPDTRVQDLLQLQGEPRREPVRRVRRLTAAAAGERPAPCDREVLSLIGNAKRPRRS